MLVGLHSDVMNSSGIKLINSEELADNIKLTRDDFLSDGTLCFPFYVDGLYRFDLAPYRFIKKDTATTHYQSISIENYVDEALTNQNDCKKVRLTWDNNGHILQTFAMFDMKTGELVYDNILFNILNPERGCSKMLLTRAETGGGGSTPPGVLIKTSLYERFDCMTAGGSLISFADGQYFVYGTWQPSPIINDAGAQIGYHYTFMYTGLVFYMHKDEYRSVVPNACAIADYVNYSAGSEIYIKYILWAGIRNSSIRPPYEHARDLPDEPCCVPTIQFITTSCYTDGVYAVVKETPTRSDIYF